MLEMLGKQRLMVCIKEPIKQETDLSMSLLEQFVSSVTLSNGVLILPLLRTRLQLIGDSKLSDVEEPLLSKLWFIRRKKKKKVH